MAQANPLPGEEPAEIETDVPEIPDLLDLPNDWLSQIEKLDLNVEIIRERSSRALGMLELRIAGLEGESLAEAEDALQELANNTAVLEAAYRKQAEPLREVIPSKDEFTLQEFLDLRARWREFSSRAAEKRETRAESEQQYQSLKERYDRLTQEYIRADRSTPARIVIGLRRMSAAVDLLTYARTGQGLDGEIAQLQETLDELQSRLEYARDHVGPGDLTINGLDEAILAARELRAESRTTRSVIQNQLVDLQEQSPGDRFKLQKLKQQMTLTSATEAGLTLEIERKRMKRTWRLLVEGDHGAVRDFDARTAANEETVSQTLDLAETWTRASQATLINPAPERSQRQQLRDFNEAQTVANESLAVIRGINDKADDISLLHSLIDSEILNRGIATPGARARLMAGKTWAMIQKVTSFRLVYIGETPLTVGSIFQFIFIILIGLLVSWVFRRMLARLEKRIQLETDSSSIYTLGRISHYLIMTIAILGAFTALGLDTGSLALVAGALSVGIGFGLQSIVANFMSGLILLFEGSLRVGDYVELDPVVRGTVREIRTRFTRINTNDNVDILVPNSDLVSFKLTNWTLREPVVRIRIQFGVAYGSDKEKVRKAALEAISDVPYTISNTPGRHPLVLLVNMGESSLDFEMRIWIRRSGVKRPGRVKATYLWALETRLHEHGIEIPFPQRDLHLKSGSLDRRPLVETSNDDE